MNQQNFKNHRKYYPLHHFIFFPVSLVMLGFAISRIWKYSSNGDLAWIWIAISALILLIIVLAVMLRQHYALGLQDRIIINEFKLRYYFLTGATLESLPYQFSKSQIFALRFAEDEELIDLMNKTIENDWPAQTIKQNIKHWKADYSRV
ncbi:DUF6526 family protein [Chryseobacterium sp. SC28]|uniref:DUF6526 family protein n=1 Tax=Chryseobacterium sp. SC28 TaxID=2268028 RepID=UPI001E53D4CC|nr:DUF6526 family protein [Chryseobacterium sp. SC28]